MKKILIIFTTFILIGFSILFIKGQKLQVITTEIDISAPPEKVWEVLTNVKDWQSWSPIIKESSGNVSLNSQLTITMKGKEKDSVGPQYNPKIIKLEKAKLFHWRAFMVDSLVMTNDKIFELTTTSTGTKLIHKETFKGLMAPLFSAQMEKGIPEMLNLMNQALKELVEKK